MHRVHTWTARVAPALLVAALVSTLTSTAAQADPPASGPGSLKTGFGTGGTWFGAFGTSRALDSMVVQPDGKILAGFYGTSGGITVVRLTSAGAVDSAWNGGSPYTWAAAQTPGDDPKGALAQDAAGRTYVTSAIAVPPPLGSEGFLQATAVLRLTADGHLDSTWGAGGVVTITGTGDLNDHGTSLAFDAATSRMYVGMWWEGSAGHTDFAVAALRVNLGTLDVGFSGDGVATTDFHGNNDTVRDIVVAPNGDVVAVGYVKTAVPGEPGVHDAVGAWRLDGSGSAVTTFGSGGTGREQFDLNPGSNSGARSVAVDSLGNFYLGVRVEGLVGANRGGVLRLDNTGQRVTEFGRLNNAAGLGFFLNNYGNNGDNAGIAVDAAGRAVVVGGAGDATVARMVDARYPLDSTFNDTGQETLGCGLDLGGAAAVATTPSGDIVVAGACANPDTTNPVVWKLVGGDQVPLPTTPLAYPSGPQYADLHATGINVNGAGRSITVAPGASISLGFTYSFDNPVVDDICDSSCITQVVAGFTNAGPDLCFEADNAELSGSTDTVNGTLTAPTRPGRYYIGFGRAYQFSCTGEGTGTWEGNGKPWSGNLTPTPAAFLAEVNVVDGVSSLTVSPDRATVPFGQRSIPVTSISADDLTGSLADLQASPLRVSPLRVSPLRVSPLRVSPLRVSPLRVSPLRVSPLRVSPLRVSPIPLSDIPLDPPNDWATVLAGTSLADQPLQNVTLQQVFDQEPAALDGLTLADLDLNRTALRNVSLTAFLLGSTPASALQLSDVPAGTDLTQSLLELELTGADLSAVYTHGIRLRGVTFADDAPLPRMRLGDLWLSQTPFGDVPLSQLPDSWYTACSGCTTLADVQEHDVDTGIKDVATVGAILGLSTTTVDPTVGQVLTGLVSRDQLGYERIDSDLLAAAAPLASSGVTYTARFTINCDDFSGATTVDFSLPAGFRAIPSTAKMTVGGTDVAVTTPPHMGAFRISTTGTAGCDGAPQVIARIDAEPGLHLGPTTDSATASFGGVNVSATDDTPVTVVDTDTDTAVSTEPGQPTGTVFLGYVSAPGNQDTYLLPALPAGTKLTVRLANIAAGRDDDLSVFGPGVPALHSSVGASPLRVSPLRVSPLRVSGTDDTTLDPASGATTAGTEPQPDVPVQPPTGSTVLGVSANRGTADESLSYSVPDGVASGPTTIVVSGYNGSHDSDQPYALLVSVDPPPAPLTCAGPSFPSQGQGTPGSAVASLPTGTETIILTDKKRLGDIYGATAANDVMARLQTLAARSDVKGVVIPVEANVAVQQAYNAWDAASCSPGNANEVVSAINAYLDGIRGSSTTLKYLVIAGGDQVVPMGRVIDRVDLENESTFASEQVYSGEDNALSGSLRGGYLLSDDPYGDLNPAPWLDSALYVPDMAIGRLVETPDDITTAVDQYVTSNGVRTPTAAYTAGYDFNSDGAQKVANILAARVGSTASRTDINETWSKTDAVNGLDAAAHGFVSINAHYDAYRALPAKEFTAGTQDQLLTPSDLPSDLTGGLLFTIGCHTGLSVADTFVATTSEAVRKSDWAQGVASRGGVLAANTGFGYGDSEAVAYSERLMADFAANLDGTMTVGQALMFAKQGYVRLPMAVVDAKVMQEATFYGLPMYRLGTTGQAAPAVLPTAPSTGTSLSESSLQTASFTGARQLVAQSGDRGTWYGVQAGAQVQVPLTMPARPIQPETTDSFARPTNGQVAHGVLLEALSTRVTSTDGAFDPVYSAVTPDSSSTRPEPGVEGAFFPATLTNVVERATPQGLRDVVVLHPGQFRSASSTSGLGFQQLADQMQYRILYSNKDDVTPPSIRTVDGTVSGGSVRFRVTTPSSDVATATVLFLAKSSTTGQGWTKVTLTSSDGGHTWTGNNSVSLPTVEQFFVQLVDSANNVSVSSKKGQDFAAPARPAGSAPVIQLSGIPVDGHVVGTQTVTILGDETATYRVDGGGSQAYTGPFTISDAGPHTVTATDASGTAQVTFTLDPAGPRITIVSPSSTAVYIVGQAIPLDFTCSRDAVTCEGSPTSPDASFGTHTFTVKARDAAGNLTSLSVTYVVRGAFVGVFQPVDDGPNSTPSVFKKNSTVPIKFQLVDASGRPLSDATATAIANTCGPTLSVAQVGTTSAPVDETTLTNPTDSGTCFRYDAAADQFIFNLSTKSLTAGKLYAVTIRFPQLASVDHTVIIGVR